MVESMEEIKLIEFKEMDLEGGTIIAGFPSIGLVSTIAANYLIDSLGLKQIGAMDSKYFPALSVVHSAEPLSPVRLYAGIPDKGKKIAIFVSEFRPKPNLISPIADVIMDWAEKKGCELLISPEGMVVEGKEMEVVKKESAYAIGSTEDARNMLIQRGIPQFKNGIIAGVSGVLLNKGKYKNFNVISILAEAHPKLRPVESVTGGLFVAGAGQAPKDIPEAVAQASGAASKVQAMFSGDVLHQEPIVAAVDEELCSGCKLCIPICPYDARVFDEEKGIVSVNEVLCEGCGSCIAACPSGAAQQKNFTDDQIYSMVNTILEGD